VILITRIPLNLSGENADKQTMHGEDGRRYCERSMCADLIKIVWTDESGKKQKELAALEDISPAGVCLQLEHPIPIDTPISILYPDGRYHGRTRYCIFQHTGYFLGIQFDPGYEWSKDQFMPSHLLEVHSLRSKGHK
jgi:hypothetical protein